MRKVLNILAMLLLLFSASYATTDFDEERYLLYNGFRIYEDQETNKVSYSIKVQKEVPYEFELRYYYNNEFVESCSKDVLLKDDEVFQKITCEIQKLGDGEYGFDANLVSLESEYGANVFNSEYIFENLIAKVDFEEKNGKTQIIINIEGEYEDITVYHRIPKEVIEYLDDSNKDDLITSQQDYEIIEADPLIAWSVDSSPTTINYTVNKKITSQQRKQFDVEITETKSFAALKYSVFALIVIIIVLIASPLLKKNVKKK